MLTLSWLTRAMPTGMSGGDEGVHRRLGHDVQRDGSLQGGDGELLSVLSVDTGYGAVEYDELSNMLSAPAIFSLGRCVLFV